MVLDTFFFKLYKNADFPGKKFFKKINLIFGDLHFQVELVTGAG